MIVDFRPHARLLGEAPLDLGRSVSPVVEAFGRDSGDLDRLRLVCDWIQYRENFRDVVDVRPILPPGRPPGPTEHYEVAVDLRRSANLPVSDLTAERLQDNGAGRVYLEEWGPGSGSRIWDFNALYWSALARWEAATGRGYEQALPGGQSDACDREAADRLIRQLFLTWDGLDAAGVLPDELCIVELGVGNGNQAKVFLDAFRDLDAHHGRGYYTRLRYLLCDYSPQVLQAARATVAEHAAQVSTVEAEATRPSAGLAGIAGTVFLVYLSNVYDNLPTDEVARIAGRDYLVQTRAYLPAREAGELAASVAATPAQLPELVQALLHRGPDLLAQDAPWHFADAEAAVEFWRGAWSRLRLQERYAPLEGLDRYALAPTVGGEVLRPLLEGGPDVRMHVSNGAVAGFTDALDLLHPEGRLVCHDLFVTDVQGYRTTFRGPGKYDGSVVNWVNGPLLEEVGRAKGFKVTFAPFRLDRGNIVTLTARAKD